MYSFKLCAQLSIPFHDPPLRINNFVDANARRLITPQLIMTMDSPYVSAKGANKAAPKNAPHFPAAALIPFNVDLESSSSYVTDGNRKVVLFGP